jgi:hypothetical protein
MVVMNFARNTSIAQLIRQDLALEAPVDEKNAPFIRLPGAHI